ncbi:MAG: hypothetical protein IKK50_02055, partial [Ruminiclostridium sp.]|nr:hypothetical protein [Ruminiclostridium sp.]
AQSRWKLAGLSAQMQVFYNEEENPVPIETDPLLQVENIHKAMKRNFISSSLILLACAVIQIALVIGRVVSNPLYVLFSGSTLASLVPWSLVILLCSAEIITYLRWYRKAKAAALEEDTLLPTRSTRKLQIVTLMILAIYLVFWFLSLGGGMNLAIGLMSFGYMAVLFALVFLLKNFMKKKQVSTKVNRIVTFAACFVLGLTVGLLVATIVGTDMSDLFEDKDRVETYEFKGSTFHIYHDDLPLTVEDLMEVDSDARYSYLANKQSSFLASKLDASQYPTMDNLEPPDLDYTLIEVKFSPLYDTFREELLSQYDYRNEHDIDDRHYYAAIDPELWGAQEAYQRCWGQDTMEEYLIFWEDAMLEINFDWTPTQEQMSIVAEKLNP